MARLFLATLLLAACVSASLAASVEYCNKNTDYPIKVKAVDIDPDPIQRGIPTKFSISASTGGDISNGKVVIDVKYFFFNVFEEEIDLCKETACPISSGDFVIAHEETLPGYTPPGSYTLTMKILGEDGKQLTCISFGFSIGFLSPVSVL